MPSISGDHVISYHEYWKEIRALAREALKEAKDQDREDEVYDLVHEMVDGHQWIIYTAYYPFVLYHSDNEDALFDEMGEQTFDSYSTALQQMAFMAMEQDVLEHLESDLSEPD